MTPQEARMPSEETELFPDFCVTELLVRFENTPPQTVQEMTWHGIALLRWGDLSRAERLLDQAHAAGNLEAGVELANTYRIKAAYKAAANLLVELMPRLRGALLFRAKRWLGVSLFVMEDTDGLAIATEAYAGYLKLGNMLLASRTAQTLAEMYFVLGDLNQCRLMMEQSLDHLAPSSINQLELPILTTMIQFSVAIGDDFSARYYVQLAHQILKTQPNIILKMVIMSNEVDLQMYTGRIDRFQEQMKLLIELGASCEEGNHSLWIHSTMIEHYGRTGQYAQATALLYNLTTHTYAPESEFLTMRGIIQYRQGEYELALIDLAAATRYTRLEQRQIFDIRRLLFMAASHQQLGQPWQTRARSALEMIRDSQLHLRTWTLDFQELQTLMSAVRGDADLSVLFAEAQSIHRELAGISLSASAALRVRLTANLQVAS